MSTYQLLDSLLPFEAMTIATTHTTASFSKSISAALAIREPNNVSNICNLRLFLDGTANSAPALLGYSLLLISKAKFSLKLLISVRCYLLAMWTSVGQLNTTCHNEILIKCLDGWSNKVVQAGEHCTTDFVYNSVSFPNDDGPIKVVAIH
jgi:hypothetical protein